MESQIKELIEKYKIKLSDINAGILQFEAMNLTNKVALQQGKKDMLIMVIKDLNNLIKD